MTVEIKVGTPRKPMYCSACGNCDCPNVSADGYWTTCPATQRVNKSAPAGTPTIPEPCTTCGAAPGSPCVYTGTEHPRFMLHQARKEATPTT